MGRSAARESLFKLIYEYNVRKERDDLTLSLFLHGLPDDAAAYLESSYNGILEHADELVSVIAGHSNGLDRKSTRLNSSHSDRSRMPSSA